jgi:hypothetical protein
LRGLAKHCDQRLKVSPTEMKDLVLCSHNLDR